ncbi:thiamine biosynthesis protein ThiI [Mariprofundus ferrinatatus]|uniref:Probable tRNA sulfurtransferase n=1 Tax=Mariprofundus ferrinatatus TaxID=1921087 RepID=A0A2K8L5H3_9PROT|nr:tRNA uracil 4-sulfurtransferase ThiI [Mariprofundus ferrinatatus]ATX82483.1 thiamine biosynthesis protein ThiI [Mariprofundus ferrinatatus]
MPKLLFHFGELSLKGKNRSIFERRMAQNIKRVIEPVLKRGGFYREYGRMTADVVSVSDELLDLLALIPGIRNFSVAHECALDLEAIQNKAKEAVVADFGPDVAGRPFRVTSRRSNKQFQFTSPQLNFEVGGFLKNQLNLAVNLNNPEIDIRVEVAKNSAYIYTRKIIGIGGLPVGSSGRGVVLFSGGIDSPVAAYSMIKRGMEVVLVHLYNSTINRDFVKIRDLARQISLYQGRVKLYLIDLEEFQRHAIAHVPAEYRMIIYKRQMIRSAAKIAHQEKGQALVTGDSLGQVASQTLANIHAIYDASDLPLLSPLIAWDKEEIIALGRRIGTYEISIEEYCDICSFLIAKHPETNARRDRVAELESLLPVEGLECPTRLIRFDGGRELDA